MCVVIINSYTGNLTSYLTIPALNSIPNSFEELAAREDLSIIVEDKSVLSEQILVCTRLLSPSGALLWIVCHSQLFRKDATSGAFKILGDSLRKNPHHVFKATANGEALIATRKVAYPGVFVKS